MHGLESTLLIEAPPTEQLSSPTFPNPVRRQSAVSGEASTRRPGSSSSRAPAHAERAAPRKQKHYTVATPDDHSAGYSSAPRLDAGVWHRILTNVRLMHPTLNRAWFDSLVPRQLPNGVIHVSCDTLAQLNFLTGSCQQAFISAAQQVTNRLGMVMFHCEQIRAGGVFDDRHEQLPLSPDYTFDNFIIGPGNQLAHAASQAVAEKPGSAYNPLFIHGGVGLGKTHLLQAICQRLLERNPAARILYLSCDSFINQFMNAVGAGDMNNFRFKFRNADMLVVDDIHFFAARERTQEEFFHTFNTLQQSGKQIVLSADAPPNEIPELEDRLVSRFNWGLVTRVEKPCYETRVAILRKKAKMRAVEVPNDVICYVAGRIDRNTRELEGAITKIQGLSQLTGRTIDLGLAREALGDNGEAEADRRITIDNILNAVTGYYGVKVSDLQSKRRNKSIAFPRQVCMYLARRHTKYSLDEIGGYFGGRDHTTVLHGVRTITRQVSNDNDVQRQVASLENQLSGT